MPTNLYGPNDNFDLTSSHVLPALIRKFHDAKLDGSPEGRDLGTGSPMREVPPRRRPADACVFSWSTTAPTSTSTSAPGSTCPSQTSPGYPHREPRCDPSLRHHQARRHARKVLDVTAAEPRLVAAVRPGDGHPGDLPVRVPRSHRRSLRRHRPDSLIAALGAQTGRRADAVRSAHSAFGPRSSLWSAG
ncbi:MAG: NAD-dependent epimerase/dehydratase family protein [Ilumatobacteraceae bacterium]